MVKYNSLLHEVVIGIINLLCHKVLSTCSSIGSFGGISLVCFYFKENTLNEQRLALKVNCGGGRELCFYFVV